MAANEAAGEHAVIPLIINNDSVVTENLLDVYGPAEGEFLYRSAAASVDDANRAVAAAKAAFPAWSKMKPYDRRDILMKAADIMYARREELIRYQMEETGAGRMFAEKTCLLGAGFLKDFAARIPSIEGSVPSVGKDGECAMVFKEPYGVILGIAPWNAPFILGVRAVALPLAAGNTAILKGSELAPKCFWAIGDIYREAGLPAGCLNILYHRTSDAAAVTTALIAHPAIRKVNFTGSTQVGSIIAATAGKYVKPVLLELGGKASAIVLDDANLEKAAYCCALGSFMHSGQICMSTERIVVQRAVADKFRQLLAESSEKLFGKATPAPVLVTSAAVKKNKALVADALSKGASVLFGDANATESSEHSLRPVVVDNVTKDMDIYSTESFGPTVSLIVVDSEEEAVALANDTEYGLTSAVFTDNLFRGLRVAKQLEAGAVHINSLTVHDEPVLPHGGWKSSGFGRFGGGTAAYDEWLQTKTVTWTQ
ncbi:aldehyde dehydrogenase [Aspergillus clavatus NRRL 1]|uniref:Vanillin dehydrogenase, putative n=1 Tax=Aspergillus clavatus (strain ATCC 1007 / CBS 513.65 / DSM 816 / NCTC 3887 / NRRL 1 / QM 1276 / 107) TaxID=344612 RepID=A1CRU5_ASPCL|nr:vanillin dehydrogenase, putative [Aspergillus clavatus NRRL 1]EAW08366.1 vanillin dehydrogenase, putative [Aspergillus clavatus NRRL 1]